MSRTRLGAIYGGVYGAILGITFGILYGALTYLPEPTIMWGTIGAVVGTIAGVIAWYASWTLLRVILGGVYGAIIAFVMALAFNPLLLRVIDFNTYYLATIVFVLIGIVIGASVGLHHQWDWDEI